ncbi:hypothetical protein [Sulfitobacter guttiformis]|uniref:LexA-binding, inner membrane-associated hydrolase n=1 Tax=Sulfitobacter guttiformis TaxID=74349 RepID=A0A420DNS4_9RHOB|nr:hypothetical protein [Sulfitobacter guttiformis]KIN73254.1 hypothetical protein Z949_2441 [Sulfitobacter guttiformis KCTC 32187]RKE95926.1 hypothetical protein C8N30_0472 [Sulfitobacter guttiformis]
MNTPAHLLIGAAAMGKRGQPAVIWAAVAGALTPDVSLYVLAAGALYVLGTPPDIVFNQLYFSDAWQAIFAVDNSFIVWGALFGIACWRRRAWAVAFAGAGLIHLALDFPLHHDDGRAHFWPISSWVFESPLSYWDHGHGAAWIAPLEGALAAAAAVRLWLWRPGWRIGVTVAALLVAELSVTWIWVFVFRT